MQLKILLARPSAKINVRLSIRKLFSQSVYQRRNRDSRSQQEHGEDHLMAAHALAMFAFTHTRHL